MLDASIPREWLQGAGRLQAFLPERIRRSWPEILGAATALFVAALFLTIDPCPDVAWQLWIGHQLRHGARFYIDIIETNPPLWFWMAMPIDWVVGLIGIRPAEAMVAAMCLSSSMSVVVSGRLLGTMPRPIRAALLVYIALTLMLMPLLDMGQREQILLIGATPYLLLAACRHERREISPLLAAGIGIGAALGFALKHYFLIAPALSELWLFMALGRLYRPLRPETIALASVGLLYAAAIVMLVPAYTTSSPCFASPMARCKPASSAI